VVALTLNPSFTKYSITIALSALRGAENFLMLSSHSSLSAIFGVDWLADASWPPNVPINIERNKLDSVMFSGRFLSVVFPIIDHHICFLLINTHQFMSVASQGRINSMFKKKQ